MPQIRRDLKRQL